MSSEVTDRDFVAQLKEDFNTVFSTDTGQKVLEHLARKCFTAKSTISVRTNNDPFVVGWKEGRRSVVLYIQNVMILDIETELKRLQQQAQEQEE